MIVKVHPSKASGVIRAPQSKSIAIRLIFLSLFTKVKLNNLLLSDDVIDAISAVKTLGVKVENESTFIPPDKLEVKEKYIRLKGSGTVLRTLIPIIAAIGGEVVIDGSESLRKRPIRRVVESLNNFGVTFSSDSLPLKISGKLNVNSVKIFGDESSQYITGLIYAFHILNGGKIEIIPPISSKSYILLTIDIFNKLGSDIKINGNKIYINPNKLEEYNGEVPGDYGLASFYALAGLISEGNITIYGLWKPERYFGDHSIVEIFRNMGAFSEYYDGKWIVKSSDKYLPIKIDIDDAPDLAMSIAGLSAIADGISEIQSIRRLRIKESDRVNSIKNILASYGIESDIKNDSLIIFGKRRDLLKYAITDCFNDHRVAMLSSILALIKGGIILNAECVNKSNPNYWQDLISLNIKLSME
ncbi:MAG: 3-phosphoshikimate 1-carboxyvinyltransferase [Saccharolobus sp.]|uniref:3-phosphoshikimate 1-carboxyvinyltransferase n=1 Tax=Saccharolobus sp. TaxID=2100761 RepID=UPI0028CFBFF3|nr:3-phosphoshikimate 1-carboxyvinyltransferase [Saccharolobus sp.]MDT7861508.1 3-phosphoshikimate 1-carboxyvinyltransferase [Saccharolobus sp.]